MDETLVEYSGMARARAFVRGLLPRDRYRILWLCGFACLFIAPSLGWWPEELTKLTNALRLADGSSSEEFRRLYWSVQMWQGEIFLLTLPIRVGGAVALFTCFFPAKRLARRLTYWVFLPVSASLLAVVVRLLILLESPPSVLLSPLKYAWTEIKNAPEAFLRLGPGFHYTLAGLLCVALAARQMRRHSLGLEKSGPLPVWLVLKGVQAEPFETQTLRFTWILLVTPFLLRILALSFTHIYTAAANAISFWPNWMLPIYQFLGQGLFSLLFVALVAWTIGDVKHEFFKKSFRIPSLINFVLAAVFPIAIACSFPLFNYLQDRFHWAAFAWGKYDPPSISSYFHLPGVLTLWTLIPALAEEIAWRGYLQPRVVQLYGLVRGIFFTGIVWGAFHFAYDFGPLMSDQKVFLILTRRLVMGVAVSVVLGWVTLRSGSVLPAAIVHGLYNMTLSVGAPLPLAPWTTYCVWLLLGLTLFHFWPPRDSGVITPGLGPPDSV